MYEMFPCTTHICRAGHELIIKSKRDLMTSV